jgi:hypothetical protein
MKWKPTHRKRQITFLRHHQRGWRRKQYSQTDSFSQGRNETENLSKSRTDCAKKSWETKSTGSELNDISWKETDPSKNPVKERGCRSNLTCCQPISPKRAVERMTTTADNLSVRNWEFSPLHFHLLLSRLLIAATSCCLPTMLPAELRSVSRTIKIKTNRWLTRQRNISLIFHLAPMTWQQQQDSSSTRLAAAPVICGIAQPNRIFAPGTQISSGLNE